MKIVHVASHFNIKYRYQEYYLMKEQLKAGHDVYILTSVYNYPFPGYDKKMEELYGLRKLEAGEFLEEGIHVIRLKTRIEYRTRVWLAGLENKIKEIHPDVVISHGIFHLTTMKLLLFKQPFFRLVVDDHMLDFETPDTLFSNLSYWLFRLFFKKRLNRIPCKIISVAGGCFPVIHKGYGVDVNKIRTIYLGVDFVFFKFDEQLRKRIRQRLGIAENTILVTCTGKMYARKNTHLIFKALKRLVSSNNIHILLVGSINEDYYPVMKYEMDNSRYPYTLLNMQDPEGLREIYCGADIVVWPDSATISTLEASACSCPVIVGTHITERCNYGNGIVINHGNLDELVVALESLVNNEELRRIMGEQGRLMVEREHSWKVIAEKFIE